VVELVGGIDVMAGSEEVASLSRAALSSPPPPSATSTAVASSTGPTDASEIARIFRI
jgi:hypothetical protein